MDAHRQSEFSVHRNHDGGSAVIHAVPARAAAPSRLASIAVAAAALLVCSVRVLGQSLQLVGLPPGTVFSSSRGVSYDGSVVTGNSRYQGSPLPVPFYGPGWVWTPGTGRTDLSGPGLMANSAAYGVSGNGHYAVGETGASLYDSPAVAYRYNRTTGQAQTLGFEPFYGRSRATAASFDGSAVGGFSFQSDNSLLAQAFRWTENGGFQSLGFTRTEHYISKAAAISADGQTVVGVSQGLDNLDAFVWTPTTGMSALPPLPGAVYGEAYGLNSDASIIVGASGAQPHGVMWLGGEITDLGVPNGYFRSWARGVSDDGAVVVGQLESNEFVFTAAIWTTETGWQPLAQYLNSIGATVPAGVSLFEATGISRDGRTLIGHALLADNTQQGFVATIPSPGGVAIATAAILAAFRRPRRAGGHSPS